MGRLHPTADELVSFLDGTADAAVHAAVTAHLSPGCADCDAAAARVRDSLALLRRDALTEVPAATVKAALGRLRAARRADTVREVVAQVEAVAARIASLLLDSGATPALAGVRSAAVAPVRQLVYEWDDDRYTVRISRGTTRAAYDVMGQILAADGHVEEVPVRLCPDGGAGRDAMSNATGEFSFDAVGPGRYSIVVGTAGAEVTLPGLELP